MSIENIIAKSKLVNNISYQEYSWTASKLTIKGALEYLITKNKPKDKKTLKDIEEMEIILSNDPVLFKYDKFIQELTDEAVRNLLLGEEKKLSLVVRKQTNLNENTK